MNSTASSPLVTDRARLLARLRALRSVDVAVIGGGASGLGIALDASLRGLSVLLLESRDFAGGTSSRATKLVHGGVRYLAQGNMSLVREALHERRAVLNNAPHLAQPLAFVVPAYRFWQIPFYGAGLAAYDALAGADSLGPTRWLGPSAVRNHLPGLNAHGLYGGVRYWDGQFDDARLAVALARTAAVQGALLLNYCPVIEFLHQAGRVCGVRWRDALDPDAAGGEILARCVINAAGVWADEVRGLDEAPDGRAPVPMVALSQGVHLVVDRAFLPSHEALLIPHTRDGRVLFAVPWLGHVILGTTDTPRSAVVREPQALPEEVAFILGEASRFLARPPRVADILSHWAGLRPLVRPAKRAGEATQSISREHVVRTSTTGLVTVLGGKWTTYRAMAEDVLRHCVHEGLLEALPACRTAHFPLVGAPARGVAVAPMSALPGLHLYGSEKAWVEQLPGSAEALGLGLTAAMVRFAIRHEYALTVEDILARRHRMLFLNARLAMRQAPVVAQILQQEVGADGRLSDFLLLAAQYATVPVPCFS